METPLKSSLALGALIAVGLALLGAIAGYSALRIKAYERVVSVKGLAEREVPADVGVWPIRFTGASANLVDLYGKLESDSSTITTYLRSKGFQDTEITLAAPAIVDKLAQSYGGNENVQLRYTATQVITVYSSKIDLVRRSQNDIAELGRKGIALGGAEYQRGEYLFTGLNDIKPAMIEEATRNARAVAEKFAADSGSRLGRIKTANQGQFTVADRDSNTPHIKNVRVVSTVEYYLAD